MFALFKPSKYTICTLATYNVVILTYIHNNNFIYLFKTTLENYLFIFLYFFNHP